MDIRWSKSPTARETPLEEQLHISGSCPRHWTRACLEKLQTKKLESVKEVRVFWKSIFLLSFMFFLVFGVVLVCSRLFCLLLLCLSRLGS